MDFSIILSKMVMLLTLLFCGFLLAKLKWVDGNFNKMLSRLTMNFFMCATIISSVANKDIPFSGREIMMSIAAMTVMMMICIGVGLLSPLGSKAKAGEKNMYRFTTTFMNAAFMGYPVVQVVFGDEALFFASMVQIPFNIFMYTYGIILLESGNSRQKLNIKSIITAPTVATLIAIILFAFNVHLPDVIADTVDTISGATVPLSMMCVGISLSGIDIKDAFTDLRIYYISFLRLIICPLLTWLIVSIICRNNYITGITILESATPVAVACSVMAIDHGKSGAFASKAILLSTLLSMITIPVTVLLIT